MIFKDRRLDMMDSDMDNIQTFEQAKARIADLEAVLDEALGTIVKRDEALELAERRICDLEEKVESLTSSS